MKTRSTPEEPPNIAAGVKARRTARIGSPSSRTNTEGQTDEGSNSQPGPSTSQNKTEDPAPKLRQGNPDFLLVILFIRTEGSFTRVMDT